MIAVVLAAGKGSRLGEHTTNLPKSLLPLNAENKTLLDYNLEILRLFDLEKILIVTGFNAEKIEEHVAGSPDIETIYNPFWNYCNVLGSLYMALDRFNDDFLFLHADTLADKPIWELLIQAEGDMVLPFERKACGEEEMKVRLEGNRLLEISKKIDSAKADGEFLGIAKFTRKTHSYFTRTAEGFFKQGDLSQYMERVISKAIEDELFDIQALDIGDHNFVEVDFEEDYRRARSLFGTI